MSLDRLWAGWRSGYIEAAAGPSGSAGAGGAGGPDECVFCRILSSGAPDEKAHVVWRGRSCVALLNAYPYTSGHLLVMPRRHLSGLEELAEDEAAELWGSVTLAVRAIKAAYDPDGVNLGANLGQAAGAGVPGHLHLHALPRWQGDTNFMTAVAEARVLPESLTASWDKLRRAWPE